MHADRGNTNRALQVLLINLLVTLVMALSLHNPIELEFRGSVAIITLNKPKKLNALTKDEFYELAQKLNEVAAHEEVTVTILTGTRSFFSA
jgi:Delta3-Delta2-enoyl-CoA isomerase